MTKPDTSRLLVNERINRMENALRSGRLDRRTFLGMIGAAGISATVGCDMADRAIKQGEAIARSRAELASGYDYIIVGAGAAGCVLAARLSEDPDVSVLLIEAGGTDQGNPTIEEPTIWFLNLGSPVDYAYTTVPQSTAYNRVFGCPRGKVLGGSTSINGLIWARGVPCDYDGWAAEGNVGWSFANVLPLFRRIESYAGGANAFRGGSGPLHVEKPVDPNPLSEAFLDAAVEVGIPFVDDLNGAVNLGAGWEDVIIEDQRRNSAARAYLHPAMTRPNLTVLINARVRKVALSGTTATGVVVDSGGETFTIQASEEVVLCAGAIDSPRLLMLSGIGPATHLSSLGIPTVVNLRVGDNLHDHAAVTGVVIQTQASTLPPLRNNTSEAFAVWRSYGALSAPDIQILPFQFGVTTEQFTVPPNSFTLAPANLVPESRGRLRLASADPGAAPLIDPRYLSEPADITRLARGLELAREIAEANAYSGVRSQVVLPEPLPNKSAVVDFIRKATSPYYHVAGTCRMGVDSKAVVAPNLKVYGINRLRVADASIIPRLPRANTMAPTMMIAEKAADLIRC